MEQGDLFVVNFEDGTIGQVLPNGTVTRYITLPKGGIANAIIFDRKKAICCSPTGPGIKILRIDRVSRQVTVMCHNPRFNQPNDILHQQKGQIFG